MTSLAVNSAFIPQVRLVTGVSFQVRSLIEDVRRVRFHKVEEGLAGLQRTSAIKVRCCCCCCCVARVTGPDTEPHLLSSWLQLTNLSAMEVNIVRPFVLKALTGLDRYVGDLEPQEK